MLKRSLIYGLCVSALAGILFFNSSFSEAAVLYGVNASYDGFYIIDDYVLGGSVSQIGPLDQDSDLDFNSFATPLAMSIRNSDNTIFVGNNSNDAGSTGDLLTVDPLTGAATKINSTPNGVGFGDIAFAPDGTLYSAGGFSSAYWNNFYEVNVNTGQLTLIGNLGDRISGMDFSPEGILYGLGGFSKNLYTINPENGQASIVGQLNIDYQVPGGIAFDPNGYLIGAATTAEGFGILFDIDVTSAMVSKIRNVDDAPQGMDFGAPVPIPGGVWLLGGGLLCLLGLRRKFRR